MTRKANILQNGQELTVWNNHTKEHMKCKELIAQTSQENLRDYTPESNWQTNSDVKHCKRQIKKMVKGLKKEPTWRGALLLNKKIDCIIYWQFLIRKVSGIDTLHCIVALRSSDVGEKFEKDMKLTKSLLGEIALQLIIPYNSVVTVLQGSAHIYTT
jgi:thymidylate synthase